MNDNQEYMSIDDAVKELVRLMDEFKIDLEDKETQKIIDKLNEIPN